jgi:hypothetical protein
MKTHAASHGTGILAAMILLAGIWFLNSCASKPIELARGTHWREAAKVAGEPELEFSYQVNGRKYDRVEFAKLDYPVVLENGRVVLVDTFKDNAEWNRRFTECLEAGELPFENGLNPLHSLVMDQKRLYEKQLQCPNKTDLWETADSAGSAALVVAALPVMAGFYIGFAMDHYTAAKERQRHAAATAALLDAGISYGNFLGHLDRTDWQATKGTYSVGIHTFRENYLQFPATIYTLGSRNGRIVWVADSHTDVLPEIMQYRKAHGLSP